MHFFGAFCFVEGTSVVDEKPASLRAYSTILFGNSVQKRRNTSTLFALVEWRPTICCPGSQMAIFISAEHCGPIPSFPYLQIAKNLPVGLRESHLHGCQKLWRADSETQAVSAKPPFHTRIFSTTLVQETDLQNFTTVRWSPPRAWLAAPYFNLSVLMSVLCSEDTT